MSRLTDSELATLLSNARQNDGRGEKWLDLNRSIALLEDLIECRAALELESVALRALMEEHDEICGDYVKMKIELDERRRADLSSEDMEALRFARDRVSFSLNSSAASEFYSEGYIDQHECALSVLDRLLSKEPKR